MNYRYRVYPNTAQEQLLKEWMDTCRVAYNYGLREIKDWCNSRSCMVDRCSISHEYIMPADSPFPGEVKQLNALPSAKKVFPRLGEVPSQVLQQALKQLHRAWEGFQKIGHGFPRFKKFGQFKSLLFPQFVKNPVSGIHIALPKLGLIPINLHRQITSGFVVKQVRIINKADRWYASINIQCDVSIPNLRKDLSVRVHSCSSCGYTTDRDVASGQVIRNRGIELISTDGQSGIQNAYADGLPGIEMSQFRSMSKSRKGVTRKSKK